jgi:hypothetical protein
LRFRLFSGWIGFSGVSPPIAAGDFFYGHNDEILLVTGQKYGKKREKSQFFVKIKEKFLVIIKL